MRLLALTLVFLASCATLRGATQLDEMTEPQLQRYSARASAQIVRAAEVTIKKGDLTPKDLDAIAASLRLLAGGGGGGLVTLMPNEVDGYGSLAIVIALSELDAQLEDRGAYDGAALTERGARVVGAIAVALDGLASSSTSPAGP